MKIEQESAVRINWFTLNVPTLVVIVMAAIHYTTTNAAQDSKIETQRIQQEADVKALTAQLTAMAQAMAARQDAIDKSREVSRAEYDKKLAPILDANVVYRLTKTETDLANNMAAVNDRIDRISSSMGQIRDTTAGTDTKVALLGQSVDQIIARLDRIFPDGAPPMTPRRN